MLLPGHLESKNGLAVTAGNFAFGCQTLFHMQMQLHPELAGHRQMSTLPSYEHFLLNRNLRHPDMCQAWVDDMTNTNGLFKYADMYSIFRVVNPRVQTVLEFYPDIPDTPLRAKSFSINFSLINFKTHSTVAEGFIGETSVTRFGANGQPIMIGPKVLKGDYADYKVEGPFGREFAALKL